MKRFISILLILCLSQSLSSCSHTISENFRDEYIASTDFQLNMEYDDLGFSTMTESDAAIYFIDGLYMYAIDKESLDVIPLCKKANCLHDKETDPKSKASCEAFVGDGVKGIFYENQAIYVMTSGIADQVSTTFTTYSLRKYGQDGAFLETVYEFPSRPLALIRHRNHIYYLRDHPVSTGEGSVKNASQLVEVSLFTKEEKILYTNDLENGTLSHLFAYGKHIYLRRMGNQPDKMDSSPSESYAEEIICFDLQNDSYTVLKPEEEGVIGTPMVYNNSLLYSYWFYNYTDDRNRLLYQSDLDGQNPNPFKKTAYTSSRQHWDQTYFYDDNWPLITIARLESVRQITVLDQQFNEIDKIDFTKIENNPDQIDFSGNDNPLRISEQYIFLQGYGDNHQGSYLICIDKAEIGTGNITPRIIWQKEAQYQSEEYILDTQ